MRNSKTAKVRDDAQFFGNEKIWKILARTAPPVMLAQLIQAMYNIVDSFFVGRFSGDGLTALSVIFPVQLIITALAVGTGVGVNTAMSRRYAIDDNKGANGTGGAGMVCAVVLWALFTAVSVPLMRPYVTTSAQSPAAIDYAVQYGTIVCAGSLGIFLESIWTKVHQAHGNMMVPMIAQIAGAVTNIVLDPLLIFGLWIFPQLGVAGAAYATVAGQVVAAIIVGVRGFRVPPPIAEFFTHVKEIFRLGYPSIFMQALYTVYIVVLNIILKGFSDDAVTVLGLYYKMQTFFFIPLQGLQTCIVPVLSYNYAQRKFARDRLIMRDSIIFSMAFMLVGVLCFELIPVQLISVFSSDDGVKSIGRVAFRIIGTSFLPAVPSLILPVFFQAIGKAVPSVLLSLTRQIFCLIPIFWDFSYLGLDYTWIAFPMAETITTAVGLILYVMQIKKWKKESVSVA